MGKVNAVIMAAGTASRFVPLSEETPKGLIEVKGEILIERQIRQLKEAGITDITVIVGYRAEQFLYLKKKFDVDIVLNEDYAKYNNTSSVIRVLDKLGDTFICSSDNYFPENVFKTIPSQSCYSALYAEGQTGEYCMSLDKEDNITGVSIGGKDSWYMVGHVFFSKEFSNVFKEILRKEYEKEETRQGYWEDVYIKYLDLLPKMRAYKYKAHEIEEFDSLDELRLFDRSYSEDTRSSVLKNIARRLNCKESQMSGFKRIKNAEGILCFTFNVSGKEYQYNGEEDIIATI